MARRRRSHDSKRDAYDISNDDSPSVASIAKRIKVQQNRLATRPPPIRIHSIRKAALRQVEDRRQWHPAGRLHRPAAGLRGPSHQLKMAVLPKKQPSMSRSGARSAAGPRAKRSLLKKYVDRTIRGLTNRIGFAHPKRIMICIRRQMRREVLFAFRSTGKGARTYKHRNQFSDVRC